MRFSIEKIKVKPGKSMQIAEEGPLRASLSEAADEPFRCAGDAAVQGSLTNLGQGNYRADVEYSVPVTQTCSDCGVEFTRQLSGRASLLFSTEPGSDADGEEERWPLDDNAVVLDDALLSDIFFALPMRPQCRPDCRGLCPICGADLNHESCSCSRDDIDPRWEKLQELRLKMEKGD